MIVQFQALVLPEVTQEHEYNEVPAVFSSVSEHWVSVAELQVTPPVGGVSTVSGQAGTELLPEVHCHTLVEQTQS